MKTIFWNVDTQYDFMRDDASFKGNLPIPLARGIEQNLADLTLIAKENKIQVVNTADWHNEKSEEISENPDFIKTFPKHCLMNTKGAEFVPATTPENPYKVDWQKKEFDENEILLRRNIILYKDKFDVFAGNPNTEKILEIIKPDRAIVYGVATNVCVDFAVRGLLERKIEVYVPLDAIKELPNLPLPYDDWKKKGAKLIYLGDVRGCLK